MDKQKENRGHQYQTNRNSGEETSCLGRWQSGRRFGPCGLYQYHRRYGNTRTSSDRGEQKKPEQQIHGSKILSIIKIRSFLQLLALFQERVLRNIGELLTGDSPLNCESRSRNSRVICGKNLIHLGNCKL